MSDEEPAPVRESRCERCGQLFEVPGKRGSPAALCNPCKRATGVRIR